MVDGPALLKGGSLVVLLELNHEVRVPGGCVDALSAGSYSDLYCNVGPVAQRLYCGSPFVTGVSVP